MRRRLIAILSAAAVALAAVLTLTSGGAYALSKVKCKVVTGYAQVDPIVDHNVDGPSEHMHTFFGNAALLKLTNPNTATYNDLINQPTNCENPNDTAGYWTPTLYQRQADGTLKPVPVAAFTAYYRAADGNDNGAAQIIPPGTELVAGATTDTHKNNWSCGQFSGSGQSLTFPDCSGGDPSKPGNRLTAHITFPSCWDGQNVNGNDLNDGDIRDNAHFAYKTGTAIKGGSCPAGFPIGVAELRETISYAYAGNGKDLVLASDAPMGMADGMSLHADYMQAWNKAGFQDMVSKCINTTQGDDNYCNGTGAPKFPNTPPLTLGGGGTQPPPDPTPSPSPSPTPPPDPSPSPTPPPSTTASVTTGSVVSVVVKCDSTGTASVWAVAKPDGVPWDGSATITTAKGTDSRIRLDVTPGTWDYKCKGQTSDGTVLVGAVESFTTP